MGEAENPPQPQSGEYTEANIFFREHSAKGRIMRTQPRIVAWAAAMIVCLIGWAAEGRAQSCDAPNPNLQIAKPAPGAAAFSGVWNGSWTYQAGRRHDKQNYSICGAMYVAITSSTAAEVTYCGGRNSYRNAEGRCEKDSGTIAGNTLTFVDGAGSTVIFTASGGSTLAAEDRAANGKTMETQFRRAE
jgi:hypothetical protein